MANDFWVDIFSQLSTRLIALTGKQASSEVVSAVQDNLWFTDNSITIAVNAVREKFLDREKLNQWLGQYNITYAKDRKIVQIIMAGNIPMVGIHDLMCGLVCGCSCYVKLSGKDAVLMGYVIGQLRDIYDHIPIYEGIHPSPDVVLAMGSDSTVRLLNDKFSRSHSLLRGSRSSVALITGGEDEEELDLLADDIFLHSGLGCRNVSHLLIPDGYDIMKLAAHLGSYGCVNPKYRNNYLQNRALSLLSGEDYIDGGFFTMKESSDLPEYLSRITYWHYNSMQQAVEWLASNRDRLQCVACGQDRLGDGFVKFGQTQRPELWNYPDNKDVIDFLTKM